MFDILPAARVTISGLAVRNGNPGSSADGGGIAVGLTGVLTLTDSTVISNTALTGGGIRNVGGGLTLNNVNVISNTGGYGVDNSQGSLSFKASTAATFLVRPHFDIVESVAPEGQIKLGDELTYTLVVSATPITDVAVYDPLDGMTFARFVAQPPGITESNNAITGTLTLTPALPLTITFVAQANLPGTAGTTLTNRACVRAPGDPLSLCQWSNQTSNAVTWPFTVFLPIVMHQSPPFTTSAEFTAR